MAEIHWDGIKISHFELVKNLLELEGIKKFALHSLKKINEQFDSKKVESIVESVDKDLIALGNPNILPKERKELVLKLLALRQEKLSEIYSHYK
uniref:hypothetical protein n=1 Tax=Roseivirga sp. TaxID=1964215 RepID=UPI00404879F2